MRTSNEAKIKLCRYLLELKNYSAAAVCDINSTVEYLYTYLQNSQTGPNLVDNYEFKFAKVGTWKFHDHLTHNNADFIAFCQPTTDALQINNPWSNLIISNDDLQKNATEKLKYLNQLYKQDIAIPADLRPLFKKTLIQLFYKIVNDSAFEFDTRQESLYYLADLLCYQAQLETDDEIKKNYLAEAIACCDLSMIITSSIAKLYLNLYTLYAFTITDSVEFSNFITARKLAISHWIWDNDQARHKIDTLDIQFTRVFEIFKFSHTFYKELNRTNNLTQAISMLHCILNIVGTAELEQFPFAGEFIIKSCSAAIAKLEYASASHTAGFLTKLSSFYQRCFYEIKNWSSPNKDQLAQKLHFQLAQTLEKYAQFTNALEEYKKATDGNEYVWLDVARLAMHKDTRILDHEQINDLKTKINHCYEVLSHQLLQPSNSSHNLNLINAAIENFRNLRIIFRTDRELHNKYHLLKTAHVNLLAHINNIPALLKLGKFTLKKNPDIDYINITPATSATTSADVSMGTPETQQILTNLYVYTMMVSLNQQDYKYLPSIVNLLINQLENDEPALIDKNKDNLLYIFAHLFGLINQSNDESARLAFYQAFCEFANIKNQDIAFMAKYSILQLLQKNTAPMLPPPYFNFKFLTPYAQKYYQTMVNASLESMPELNQLKDRLIDFQERITNFLSVPPEKNTTHSLTPPPSSIEIALNPAPPPPPNSIESTAIVKAPISIQSAATPTSPDSTSSDNITPPPNSIKSI